GRADGDGHPVRIEPTSELVEAGVGPGLSARGQGHVDRPGAQPRHRRVLGVRTRAEVLDHPGQIDEIVVGRERTVPLDAGAAGDQALPGRVDVAPETGHSSVSDHHDPIRHPRPPGPGRPHPDPLRLLERSSTKNRITPIIAQIGQKLKGRSRFAGYTNPIAARALTTRTPSGYE